MKLVDIPALDNLMLPCINKQVFGFECLGCGLQRSIALIFQGEFYAAFIMYPAIYTLIILALFIIFNSFKTFHYQEAIKKWLFIGNITIIIISYIFKLTNH